MIFQYQSNLDAPVSDAFSWHCRKGAFERLSPPWEKVRVMGGSGTVEGGGTVSFKIKTGPVWSDWKANHVACIKNEFFADEQVEGPFASWRHEHRFTPDKAGRCVLTDHIEYGLPMEPFGRWAAGGMVRKKMQRMFGYRHRVTKNDLALHARYGLAPQSIVISGASGVLGSVLAPFFSTGGHRVSKLVRRAPRPGFDEIFWDPASGRIDGKALEGADAVIHLAGENIGEGRFTEEKKRRAVESRVKGTGLLAKTLAGLKNPPGIFICASAVGYYGNRGDDFLDEYAGVGRGFAAELCRKWEEAAAPALAAGIRTVFMRIGVVLTPAGGALKKLMLPSMLGLGGHMGNGRQYISWISPDDVAGAALHAMATPGLAGPVNLVAPKAATSHELAVAVAGAFKKPALFNAPEFALRTIFGELADEVILASARVVPARLASSGYHFSYPDLRQALAHVLGV